MKRLTSTLGAVALLALGAACSAGGAPSGGASGGTGATTGSGGTAAGGKGSGGSSTGGKGSGGSSTGGSSTGGSATGGSSTGGSSGGGTDSGGSGGAIGEQLDCPAQGQLGSPALRLLTRRELESTLNDIFPSVAGKWTDTLTANSATLSGFDNDAGANVTNQMVAALADTAISVGAAVTGSGLTTLLPCAGTTKDHACAKTFVDQFGLRLFRRPMTDAEETRYLTLFDSGLAIADFPTALKYVIAGMIQSPYAVYRSEIGTPGGSGRTLTPYEVATELSYTFAGSTPTADMLDKVAKGTSIDLVSTAKTLLATPSGKAAFQHFFEAYLAYTGGAAATRTLVDPAPEQGYDFPAVAADMLAETQHFIDDVVVTKKGGLIDLLTANTSNPSLKLAQHFYQWPSAPSADFASVTRPAGQGIGVLAQGSFLSSHANVGASSPTQRGLFVYYRLMCQAKLTPPNGKAPPVPDTPANTTRDLYEQIHAAPGTSCAGCHQYFDPIGFGFEQFDQAGRFRTQQSISGAPHDVDASGQAIDANGNVLYSFKTEEELAQALAAQPESFQCLSAYLSTYAFGSAASCLGPTLTDNKKSIVDAYAELAAQPNFTSRAAQ